MRLFDKIIERYLSASPRTMRLFIGCIVLGFFVTVLCILPSCKNTSKKHKKSVIDSDPTTFIVTGYCNCKKCCSWKYSWFGFGPPVYSAGKLKGKPKKVGLTASGTRAKHGTIAADTSLFPFGTTMEIEGYGIGKVEDVGGAIKGRHIDLWFPSHKEALKWGSKRMKVKILNKPNQNPVKKKK